MRRNTPRPPEEWHLFDKNKKWARNRKKTTDRVEKNRHKRYTQSFFVEKEFVMTRMPRWVKRKPKRKHKRKGRRKKSRKPTYKFKIILARNGKQTKYLGTFKNIKDCYTRYKELYEENENEIVFPVRYINGKDKIREAVDEIIILKLKEEIDSDVTMLRNEYGEFVPHTAIDKYTEESRFGKRNNREWVIFDKHPWYVEESFWLYGKNPRRDRKDFNYIYEQLIGRFRGHKEICSRVIVYRNKLISDYGQDMDIVFCKNESDANRLYTELEDRAIKEKMKCIIWSGQVNDRQNASYWLDRLQRKTNFNRVKLRRTSLRP